MNDNCNENGDSIVAGVVGLDGVAKLPSFAEDPLAYLRIVCERPPSRDNLWLLAGTVASLMKKEAQINHCSQLAFLYIKAASHQFKCEYNNSTVAIATASARRGSSNGSGNNNAEDSSETIRAQRQNEILETVGQCVVQCKPRRRVSESGIISTLSKLLDIHNNSHNKNNLSNIHVEFLQACLMAGHYRFAYRTMCLSSSSCGLWPRPNLAVTVYQVLSYFYLRGMVSMACHDWKMAKRCFWTCLSTPAEIVSPIAIAAWKKMVLVQCLLVDDDYQQHNGGLTSASSGPPLSLPKSLPAPMERFLRSAISTPTTNRSQKLPKNSSSSNAATQPPPPPSMLLALEACVDNTGEMITNRLSNESIQQQQQDKQKQHDSRSGGEAFSVSSPESAKVYIDLVHAFLQRDYNKFRITYTQNSTVLTTDGNISTIQRVKMSLWYRQLYHLSRIYSVVPISELAKQMEMDEIQTKQLLLQMSMGTNTGSIRNRLSSSHSLSATTVIEIQDDGMVVFTNTKDMKPTENSIVYDDNENQSDGLAEELIELNNMVQKLSVTIASKPAYQALSRRIYDARLGPRGVEDV